MADAKTLISPSSAMSPHTNIKVPQVGAGIERGSAQYRSLCQVISQLALPYLQPRNRVVDLAARGGDWSEPLIGEACHDCRFLLFNQTEEQMYQCLDRFRMAVRLGLVQEFTLDLEQSFPDIVSNLTLSLFALGELDQERRAQVLDLVHRNLDRRGALILVEDQGTGQLGSDHSWERDLEQAGFSSIRRVWQAGRNLAWLAQK